MMPGTAQMPMLHVDSLDTQDTVKNIHRYIEKYTSIMFIVLDATAFTDMRFGQGSGPIFVDNAACFGDELRLTSCTYDSHTSDCTHAEDAGLRCSGRCKLCVCKIDYLMMLNCVQCSVSMVISDLLVEPMT